MEKEDQIEFRYRDFYINRIMGKSYRSNSMNLEAIHKKTGKILVIKSIQNRRKEDATHFTQSKKSSQIHNKLKHPNILKCFHYEIVKQWDDENGKFEQLLSYFEPSSISLLTLALNMRSEQKRYSDQKTFSKEYLQYLLQQTVSVFAYLQEKKIVHTHISPSCLLVNFNGDIRLNDLGSQKISQQMPFTKEFARDH